MAGLYQMVTSSSFSRVYSLQMDYASIQSIWFEQGKLVS
jgi:hypothetical protein